MALFKISQGLKANLPEIRTAGYCWYTTDDSLFYIDFEDENGVVQRKALNAKEAEKLTGATLATILNSTDLEIPTSKAVLDALEDAKTYSDNNLKAAKSHSDANFTTLKNYTDGLNDTVSASISAANEAIEQKTRIEFIIWEEAD